MRLSVLTEDAQSRTRCSSVLAIGVLGGFAVLWSCARFHQGEVRYLIHNKTLKAHK